jgi:hypothetical protein
MDASMSGTRNRDPWNKGRLIGQKLPLKLKEIWAIRIRLQLAERLRDLALFNLAIDSKLRGCDLVSLRVKDVARPEHLPSCDRYAAKDAKACPVRDY